MTQKHHKDVIKANQDQLLERIQTNEEKEQRIEEQKKKIQELEKFKFVLDYKIKELRQDICPKEA